MEGNSCRQLLQQLAHLKRQCPPWDRVTGAKQTLGRSFDTSAGRALSVHLSVPFLESVSHSLNRSVIWSPRLPLTRSQWRTVLVLSNDLYFRCRPMHLSFPFYCTFSSGLSPAVLITQQCLIIVYRRKKQVYFWRRQLALSMSFSPRTGDGRASEID